MSYWFFKSEPDTWSWDGVGNYQARNYMRQMAVINLRNCLMAFSLLFLSPAALAQAPSTAEAVAESGAVITANVKGMVCDFCARAVEKVFSKQDGVTSIDVDLDKGAIIVQVTDASVLSDETVEKLVRDSGYSLDSIERSEATG